MGGDVSNSCFTCTKTELLPLRSQPCCLQQDGGRIKSLPRKPQCSRTRPARAALTHDDSIRARRETTQDIIILIAQRASSTHTHTHFYRPLLSEDLTR